MYETTSSNTNIKRGIILARVSTIDARIWVCKLRHRNILQFEYKDLPKEFKNKALLHRAKGEGLITSLGKNGSGRHLWRISDTIKCSDDNEKKRVEIEGEEKC